MFEISIILRNLLEDETTIESVSLRTMLNFNRIFEQEMLREIRSEYAYAPITIDGLSEAKTLRDSVQSFVDSLPTAKKTEWNKSRGANLLITYKETFVIKQFIEAFTNKHGFDPKMDSAKW